MTGRTPYASNTPPPSKQPSECTRNTQAKLAKKLNTDNGVISRYESGKTLILTSFLVEYSNIFNISCDYLLGKIDEKIKLNNLLPN